MLHRLTAIAALILYCYTQSFSIPQYANAQSALSLANSDEPFCLSSRYELSEPIVKNSDDRQLISNTIPVGYQVVLEASAISNCSIKNYPILMLFEVRNETGITQYFAYQNISLNYGDKITSGFSWTAQHAGSYLIRYVLSGCETCSGNYGMIRSFNLTVTETEAQSKNLNLILGSDKPTYARNENVTFSAIIQNDGDQPITLTDLSLSIKITDSTNGDTLTMGATADLARYPIVQAHSRFDLSKELALIKWNPWAPNGYGTFKSIHSGKYIATAEFSAPHMESNTYTLTLAE